MEMEKMWKTLSCYLLPHCKLLCILITIFPIFLPVLYIYEYTILAEHIPSATSSSMAPFTWEKHHCMSPPGPAKIGVGETKTFKQNSGWLQGHYIYFNLELSNVSQVWRNTAVSIDYNVQLVEVNKDCQISNFWLIMNQSASAIIEVVCQNNILIVCLDLPCMYIQVVQKKHLLEERFCFSTLSLRKRGIN